MKKVDLSSRNSKAFNYLVELGVVLLYPGLKQIIIDISFKTTGQTSINLKYIFIIT